MEDWRSHLQVPLALLVTFLTVILISDLPQVESQSFFPSRQQCLRFPRSSFFCSFLPVHYSRPLPPLGFHTRRRPRPRRPPPPFTRGQTQRPRRKLPRPIQSAEESMESQPNTDFSSSNSDLINPLRRVPHPMGMEMEHLLSLPPVTFTKEEVVQESSSNTKKSKKRPAKVKWRITETNTIEKEMDHLSRLMAWQPKPKSRSATPRPPPSTTTAKPPSSSEEPHLDTPMMTPTAAPMMMNRHKKRPGNSWMKETMEEMPTVMKTIPLMTTFAKAALILNRKSKQDQEEEQQQKQQQEFNSNRPNFFSYTNAFLLYSKDAMGPVRADERKKPKKKKKKKSQEAIPELTKEEMLEEQRRKREMEKSEKIRKSIERLHLTRAIIGVVSDSLNLASNKINLINTVFGSSLIGGGNNNPGGGGGGGGGGILSAAKQKAKLHGQKFTNLIKAATSAGVSGTGVISGILGKNPILQLPFQARANLTEVVDSYATLVTREAIHNATLSEL